MNTIEYTQIGDLSVATELYHLINDEIIPNTDITTDGFWQAFIQIVRELGPENQSLLEQRDRLQRHIDNWHEENPEYDLAKYQAFLKQIGYLVDVPTPFQITTNQVDLEIAKVAGPQLVAPLDNPRYVLNAVNARWGSLYDALYSTDVVSERDGCRKIKKYNPVRGNKVIKLAKAFLDRYFPLERQTHTYVTHYLIKEGKLIAVFGDETSSPLLKSQQFIGYTGSPESPSEILLSHHGLHVELRLGKGYFIGFRDMANLYDIHMESALTTIMDCEDSVASVDVEDKISVYKNWLYLMKGMLSHSVEKNGEIINRQMNLDRVYKNGLGETISLPGRSLMLIRHVGAHLFTDVVLVDQEMVPEHMLDAMITTLAAKHSLKDDTVLLNSRTESIYCVKPKMHGPDEVSFANKLFDRVEDALSLPRHTMKIGIMDEERRTSVNLTACIRQAKERLIFINTGFLDRTGDDIHTNMLAGAVPPKNELKTAPWLQAYESSNIHIGLQCGLKDRAQMGKGMWTMPDEMDDMMQLKVQQLKTGANTAWVPSPIAATLHAIHYHRLNIKSCQKAMLGTPPTKVEDILKISLLPPDRNLSALEIRHELENNAQAILGYVSRWVGQGVGCSKVPDLNNIYLMEDRATLRISSQHIANWLQHGIVTEDEVIGTMKRMAIIVDRQNQDDKTYQPMAKDFENSESFLAAMDLVFKGQQQPNGYTEFILYKRRQQVKLRANNK